jgi:hypothetical protein
MPIVARIPKAETIQKADSYRICPEILELPGAGRV